jgi:hypothetical protein
MKGLRETDYDSMKRSEMKTDPIADGKRGEKLGWNWNR